MNKKQSIIIITPSLSYPINIVELYFDTSITRSGVINTIECYFKFKTTTILFRTRSMNVLYL